MNELFYNIKLTFGFIIVMTFIAFRNIKLEYMTNMQTIGFLSLDRDYTISTANVDYYNDDGKTIYIFKNPEPRKNNNGCLNPLDGENIVDIIPECSTKESRRSIRCLKKIKEKAYGYVNGLYFIPSDKNCLSTKNLNSYK